MKPLAIFIVAVAVTFAALMLVARVPYSDGQGAVEIAPPSTRTNVDRLGEFIRKNEESADPKVVDEVGAARLRLGYAAARHGNFGEARGQFLAAADRTGTEASHPDFGSIADQGRYQAAVCLVAEGRSEEARVEFERFLQERPLSPLVFAAHRRLSMLNGGKGSEAQDRLLQLAVEQQEASYRFETSVCGPKVIEYLLSQKLLPQPKQADVDYRTIAKLCGTNDEGTTIDGMRSGLAALGIQSFAFRLNRRDFAQVPTPAILLREDHYVALIRFDEDRALIYDPRFRRTSAVELPPASASSFYADVITFQVPHLTVHP
jgi:hypothetical protein